MTVRVLYIIDSLGQGGAERSLADMAPHLVAAGVDLHVAVLHERRGFTDDVKAAGVPVYVLAGNGRLAWFRSARRLIKQLRPDVVHTTLFDADQIGRVAAWTCRVPVISSLVSIHYGPEQEGEIEVARWKFKVVRWVDIATSRLVTRFHAVSNTVADTMAPRLHVPRDRIEVIYRGRDRARLGEPSPERRARVRRQLGIADDVPVLLSVARHEPGKGLETTIEALSVLRDSIPDVRLVIAGREGRSTSALVSLGERLGVADRVDFLGLRDDVPELMCAADILVVASEREGLPGAVLEAMALELPVIASDIAPNRETLGADTEVQLFEPGDVNALVAAVSECFDHRSQRPQVRRARVRFDDEFAIRPIIGRTATLYRSVAPEQARLLQ